MNNARYLIIIVFIFFSTQIFSNENIKEVKEDETNSAELNESASNDEKIIILEQVEYTKTDAEALGFELCVGAKGAQKAGYCKHEYEAYLTRGSCVARGGGWVSGAGITLYVNSPSEFRTAKGGTTYVNANARKTGGCSHTCASARAVFGGSNFTTPNRCNKKSYE